MRDKKLPITVFSILKAGAMKRVVTAKKKARWSTWALEPRMGDS